MTVVLVAVAILEEVAWHLQIFNSCFLSGERFAHEIQSFADKKNMKKFSAALKTIYCPQSSGTTPLLSADWTSLLTDKEAVLKRWAEHFDGVLNRPSSINDEAINRLPQVECNSVLDELPIVSETVKAIKLWSSGKAPRSYVIPAEMYKTGGPPVAEKLTELFHIMWRKQAIPQEFKDATIIHLFKRKETSLWQSSRHLFFVHCWEDHCQGHTESIEWTPWIVRASTRKPVRKDRGTIDIIFTARQLQEKCQEQNVDLYMILPKHLTQSVAKDCRKLWQSLAVLPNS